MELNNFNLTASQLALWQEFFPKHRPQEFVKIFAGKQPTPGLELVEGTKQIKFCFMKDAMNIANFWIVPDRDLEDIYINNVDVISTKYGQGIATELLANLIKLGQENDYKKLGLSAQKIGSAAWATLGFKPTRTSWGRLFSVVMERLYQDLCIDQIHTAIINDDKVLKPRAQATIEILNALKQRKADGKDAPEDIRVLAALDYPIVLTNKSPIAKLCGRTNVRLKDVLLVLNPWQGNMDITPGSKDLEVLNAYILAKSQKQEKK